MAIDYDKLLALKIPDAEHSYGDKDTMLYALGIGLGHDPTNRAELDFVYEKNLKALPTFACLLGYPGFWVRDLDTGIDWVRIVNGEQGFTLNAPVKPRGTVVGKTRIVEVIKAGNRIDLTTPIPEHRPRTSDQVRFLAACPLTRSLAFTEEQLERMSRV